MYDKTIKYIKDLYGSDNVPLSVPKFMGNEKKYLNECIDTTFVSSVGQFVDRFEKDMEAYTGAKRAVVCVSGTNALHMAMMLAGVERDDEVLTQALTFIATCNAISYIGAHPVFIDVDRSTMGLSPDAIKQWLSGNAEIRNNECYDKQTGRRVKACVPMHTFGHPVRIEELADMQEAAACGTACVISPIDKVIDPDKGIVYTISDRPGPVLTDLYKSLQDIQYGRAEDRHGWCEIIRAD